MGEGSAVGRTDGAQQEAERLRDEHHQDDGRPAESARTRLNQQASKQAHCARPCTQSPRGTLTDTMQPRSLQATEFSPG